MIASRIPPLAGKPGRPELLLICGSSLTVIAILCIVTFLLIREHANAQEAATRSATTIAQLTTTELEALNATQIDAFTTTQLAGMTAGQLAAIRSALA